MSVVKTGAWPMVKPLLLGVALTTLTGCSTLRNKESEPQVNAPADGSVQHSFNNSSVVGLWQQAEVARQSGDFIGAFKHLRKALETDPSDPVIWSRLAEMALRLNKPDPAEKYAARSNQLAGGNNTLIYRNWLIIQRAREVNNDVVGANDALQKANQYRP